MLRTINDFNKLIKTLSFHELMNMWEIANIPNTPCNKQCYIALGQELNKRFESHSQAA